MQNTLSPGLARQVGQTFDDDAIRKYQAYHDNGYSHYYGSSTGRPSAYPHWRDETPDEKKEFESYDDYVSAYWRGETTKFYEESDFEKSPDPYDVDDEFEDEDVFADADFDPTQILNTTQEEIANMSDNELMRYAYGLRAYYRETYW